MLSGRICPGASWHRIAFHPAMLALSPPSCVMAARSPFGPFCRRTRPGLLGFSAGLVTTDHSPENRKVVLLSGGVESTTVLHMERDSGTFVIPLFVDYAQRGAEMERAASAAACKSLGLEMLEMNAAGIGETFRSLQGKQRLHVPVPHRNLLILSLALSLAAQQSATAVVLALQAEDGDWYPSASPAFFTAFAAAAATLEPGVDLQAPLRTMRKADVIRAGAELGVDFAQCYSCMRGGQHHCGTCRQCLDRRAAFTEAGIADPTVYTSK